MGAIKINGENVLNVTTRFAGINIESKEVNKEICVFLVSFLHIKKIGITNNDATIDEKIFADKTRGRKKVVK